MRLRAARALLNRVPVKDIILEKTDIPLGTPNEDGDDTTWFEEFESTEFPNEFLEECKLSSEALITKVRNLWELECLVRALDSMETLSSLAEINREYVRPGSNPFHIEY